jgi:hypothetical protein
LQCRGADAATQQEAPGAVTVLEHERTFVWVWGSEPPAFSIGYEKPTGPGDSGYTVLFEDAPDPGDLDKDGRHPAVYLMCSHCLLEEHSEVEPGLQIAREYGVADLADGGEWIVGDLSRLAPGVNGPKG